MKALNLVIQMSFICLHQGKNVTQFGRQFIYLLTMDFFIYKLCRRKTEARRELGLFMQIGT